MNNTREQQKQQSRARILKSAAELFGKQGLQATGIDQIMKKAGLTAGAFYAHFKSKDHLIEEVLWSQLPRYQNIKAEDFVAFYLTTDHRDRPESACPLASFGSDLARADIKLKKRVTEKLVELIDERLDEPEATKQKVLQGLSLAVGAMILSRLTKGSELSDEFLECHR